MPERAWEEPVTIRLRGYLPPSMNRRASGYGQHWSAARSAKKRCEDLLRPQLIGCALPMDFSIAYIVADVVLTFPTHRKSRDSGNFKMVLEKALGDVLQERWIRDDSHQFFRLGIVDIRERRGVRETAIRLAWHR